MADIFINYRSDDAPYAAGLVDERLRTVFGDGRVFRDCRSLDAGADFPPDLWHALRSSRVLLALIGPRWLTLTDARGVRRLDLPDDYVAREIADALSRDIAVIPVLLDGARRLAAHELPERIRGLATRQDVELQSRDPGHQLSHLVDEVARWVPRPAAPSPGGKSFSATSNSGDAFAAETMTIHDRRAR